MSGRSVVVVVAFVAWIAGCASPTGPDPAPAPAQAPAAAPAPATVPAQPLLPFSAPGALDPSGPWVPWTLPAKRPTVYRGVEVDGVRVLEAVADRSVSGLSHRVDVDPEERPFLEWRWRVDATLDGADVGDRNGDDAPVRIVLAFDGDVSTLPLKEQMFFERVKLLAGRDMPYATLMYVWGGRRPPESVVVNPHTTRVRKIVVESGRGGVRTWRSYRRDIVADYVRAYGRRPGRLVAVGVMSDSDNTRQRVRGWYGDIRLAPRPR